MVPRRVHYLDIPCVIEMGNLKYQGLILQMNFTGVMVEMETINFRPGQIINLSIAPDNEDLQIMESMRSIKNYEKFFRQKKDSKELQKAQGKRLAELHFLKLNEINRQKISRYLGRVKVMLGQKK